MNENEMNHKLVGFRFLPSDEELINYYLKPKALGLVSNDNQPIAEINLLNYEPWDLPEFSVIKSNDPYWYFFYQLDYKYLTSKRANRITKAGYWKATGKEGEVKSAGTKQIIGSKKILVFHKGRVSKAGRSHRTDWVLHEYHVTAGFPNPENYVICCLKKSTNGKTCNRKKKKANGKASTSEGESSQSPFDFVNHVAENTVPQGEAVYVVDPPSQVDQLYNHQGQSYLDLPLSNGFGSDHPSHADLEANQFYSKQSDLKAVFELLMSQLHAEQGPSNQDLSLFNGFISDPLSHADLETNCSNIIGCPRKFLPETIIGYFEFLSRFYPEQGLSYQDLSLSNGFSSGPPSQADTEEVNCYFELLPQLYAVQEASYKDLPLLNGFNSDCDGDQTQIGNIELEENFSLSDLNLINEREAYPVEAISHKNLVIEGEGLELPLESISEISSIENGGMSSDANNEVAIAQATEHVTAIDLQTATNGQAGNGYGSCFMFSDTPRHVI